MDFVFIILFVIVFACLAIYSYVYDKKKKEAFRAAALRLGLNYDPAKDRDVPRELEFIDRTRAGRDRYAFNTFQGMFRGQSVRLFDYHYKTGSGKNTHHHYLSFYLLRLPITVPELTIGPEGFFSKIAQAFGYDDIDFESHEFSRKFCVRSRDKKFAYDICHTGMMEYLLDNQDLTLEMERDTLAFSLAKRLSPETVETDLGRLLELRRLIPDYVINRSS